MGVAPWRRGTTDSHRVGWVGQKVSYLDIQSLTPFLKVKRRKQNHACKSVHRSNERTGTLHTVCRSFHHYSLRYYLSPQLGLGMRRTMRTFTAVKRLGIRVNTGVTYALPVTSPLHLTKFPRSTSATRAITVLSSIILPLQKFFSRVFTA